MPASAGSAAVSSSSARGSTIGSSGEHFGFLRGVAIDQHVVARERLGDLSDSLMPKHPELLANPEIEGATLWARQQHLYDRDQPDFPDLIGRFRAILDEVPGHMSVGELFASEAERAVALTADRHMVFDWALLQAPWAADAYNDAIWLRETMFGRSRWLANVLSNHDQSRQASRLSASAGIADTDAVLEDAVILAGSVAATDADAGETASLPGALAGRPGHAAYASTTLGSGQRPAIEE